MAEAKDRKFVVTHPSGLDPHAPGAVIRSEDLRASGIDASGNAVRMSDEEHAANLAHLQAIGAIAEHAPAEKDQPAARPGPAPAAGHAPKPADASGAPGTRPS